MLTNEAYQILVEKGILGKIEMLHGVVYVGNYRLAWSDEQRAAARELGVELPEQ